MESRIFRDALSNPLLQLPVLSIIFEHFEPNENWKSFRSVCTSWRKAVDNQSINYWDDECGLSFDETLIEAPFSYIDRYNRIAINITAKEMESTKFLEICLKLKNKQFLELCANGEDDGFGDHSEAVANLFSSMLEASKSTLEIIKVYEIALFVVPSGFDGTLELLYTNGQSSNLWKTFFTINNLKSLSDVVVSIYDLLAEEFCHLLADNFNPDFIQSTNSDAVKFLPVNHLVKTYGLSSCFLACRDAFYANHVESIYLKAVPPKIFMGLQNFPNLKKVWFDHNPKHWTNGNEGVAEIYEDIRDLTSAAILDSREKEYQSFLESQSSKKRVLSIGSHFQW